MEPPQYSQDFYSHKFTGIIAVFTVRLVCNPASHDVNNQAGVQPRPAPRQFAWSYDDCIGILFGDPGSQCALDKGVCPIVKGRGDLYCRTFHRAISRPANGKYRCWRCLREFDVGWR